MLKKLYITNPMGELLEIDLQRPEQSGLYIRSITGLGPPNASLSYNKNVTIDGSTLSSSSVETRNIVIEFGFYNWARESIEEIRNKTYRYFPLKKEITIDVFTDLHPNGLTIKGLIEKNEPDIFSSEEGCQISIVCMDPYFRNINSEEDTVIIENPNDYRTVPKFSFPFPNSYEPLYSSDINSHVFSELEINEGSNRYDFTIINPGTTDCGMYIKINVKGENGYLFRFVVNGLDTSFRITPAYLSKVNPSLRNSFIPGDELTITTIPGKLSVYLKRSGTSYNILNSVSYLTSGLNPWPILNPGRNNIDFYGYSYISKMEIIMDSKYEGV